ncbi:MAG: type II secretion system protein M [Candidatus Riflebacteria bacterium]|nr:type II secretion system protein M [Candidatus Riflebacteria bacterium]
MGTLRAWWNGLQPRERRALLVLAVVGPAVLLWWGVTVPLLDRRAALRRAVDGLARQAVELRPLLAEARQRQARTGGAPSRTSEQVFTRLETLLAGLPAGVGRPAIHRREQVVGEGRQIFADLRLRDMPGGDLWAVLGAVASAGLPVAGFELSKDPTGQGFAGFLLIWCRNRP